MITNYDFDSKFAGAIYHKDEELPRQMDLSLNEPVIIRVSHFNDNAVKSFMHDMDRAHLSGQSVIPIVCDSYGGQPYSLLAMIDIIEKATVPVATIVEGKAMSCGSILAACGDKGHRYIGPNATIMIHDVSSGSIGKVSEIKASAQEAERLNKIVFSILDNRSGKNKDYFWNKLQDMGRADWFLNAKTAKKHNIVDHIGIPTFNVKVKIKYKLSL